MASVLRILLILTVPILIAVGTFTFLNRNMLSPLDPSNTNSVIVEVAPGKPFSSVAETLAAQGIVKNTWGVQFLAKALKAETKIKAGEYEVSPSMTPRQVLEKLMSGEVVQRIVNITPGMSIVDIPKEIEAAKLLPSDEFAKALKDPALLVKAGISASSFEGYLAPGSYQFSRPVTPWQIIIRMIEAGESEWKPELQAKADELRLSRHEVLTLASMIEKETTHADERTVISSVFHNRLKQGMKLQSEPTMLYGLENFDGTIKPEDYKNPHAYNTFIHLGLPLGPIANPSQISIQAALFPSETTYLFFVEANDGSGTHVFAQTFREYQEALAKHGKSVPPSGA